jgi:spoIIIJ-associated protein
VEWVETTGRTVDDAKEAALDELGVDESDAEFEVLEEARAGLFGRLRSEARVRARVRPTAPRAKEDRRDRRRRTKTSAGGGANGETPASGTDAPAGTDAERAAPAAVGGGAPGRGHTDEAGGAGATGDRGRNGGRGGGRRRGGPRGPGSEERPDRAESPRPESQRQGSQRQESTDSEQREGTDVEVALDEQGRIAQDFLTQLSAEFGLDADVRVVRPDEDTVDLQLEGSDLGLLIGPKGATLLAIQDLTRTVVHHQTGAGNGRIHVDVGGYRQKRNEALARFAQQVATTVQQSGTRSVLEPMSAADRKVVHDAITDIDGVATISEGEEPQRRVVVVPADR